MKLYYFDIDTDIGVLWVGCTNKGLANITLPLGGKKHLLLWAKKYFNEKIYFDKGWSDLESELLAYFRGKRKSFDISLDLKGTDFQKSVWKELIKIPYGETRSYGNIAEAIGNKNSSRAVGYANNQNPISIVIPCHRVIGSNGDLIGYGGGLDIKIKLLTLEGNTVHEKNKKYYIS